MYGCCACEADTLDGPQDTLNDTLNESLDGDESSGTDGSASNWVGNASSSNLGGSGGNEWEWVDLSLPHSCNSLLTLCQSHVYVDLENSIFGIVYYC